MCLAIEKLKDLGAIQQCEPKNDQFISDIFLAPKANGGHRFILNLKHLNRFVAHSHFKMEDHRIAAKMIPKNGFMASIDLKESYLVVPIAPCHRKYLRFQFQDRNLQIITYEFVAMPYGLSSAPLTFTKIMKEVVTHLRSRGFRSVVYLDDLFLVEETYEKCLNNVNETLRLLQCLGFVINFEKSRLHPQQSCKFLGFIYNSVEMTISLPSDKRNNVLQLVKKFSCRPKCSIRQFARLIGVLTSSCPAMKYGWMYTKNLERQKYLALNEHQSYDKIFRPSLDTVSDLVWWAKHVPTSSKSLVVPNYDYVIFTDASQIGWGAFSNNKRVNGAWKDSERNFHINYLELLAVFFGLKCFVADKADCNVLLRVDNTTAISYINRMGGVQFPHLNNLTRTIWQWCEERNIWIFVSYINSKDNVEADQESRRNPDIDWQLSPIEFHNISSTFGEPMIDLFASRTNTKCKTYVSWKPDPDALTVDAFTINWKPFFFYAFPPFPLLLKCIQKIINDEAEGILIFPIWPTQPWFPIINNISVSQILHFTPDFIRSSSSSRTPHLHHLKHITLGAAVLSGRRFY